MEDRSQTVYVVYCNGLIETIYFNENLADRHAIAIEGYYREEEILNKLPSWVEEKENINEL